MMVMPLAVLLAAAQSPANDAQNMLRVTVRPATVAHAESAPGKPLELWRYRREEDQVWSPYYPSGHPLPLPFGWYVIELLPDPTGFECSPPAEGRDVQVKAGQPTDVELVYAGDDCG